MPISIYLHSLNAGTRQILKQIIRYLTMNLNQVQANFSIASSSSARLGETNTPTFLTFTGMSFASSAASSKVTCLLLGAKTKPM